MISRTKKLLGNSTAMMLLFLSAGSAMYEDLERDRSTAASSSSPYPADPRKNFIAGLIQEVKILQAYESDEIGCIIKDDTPLEIRKIVSRNLRFNETILFTLEKLQKNQLSESTALEKILRLRYDFICSRYTNDSIFHDSPSTQETSEHLSYNRMNLSTDRYQTYTRIILGIASMVDLRTLPANTKTYLRASPTICSLLEDSSKDIGHPNEAFTSQVTTDSSMKDREYFITHILNSEEISLTSYSSFFKETRIFRVTPSEKKSLNPKWRHPYALSELPYPEFLKPYPVERSKRAPLVTSAPFSTLSSSFTPFATSSPVNPPPSIEFSSSNPLEELQKPALFLIPEEPSLPVIEATASLLTQTDSEPISGILEVREESDSAAASSNTSPNEELRSETAHPEESQTSEFTPPRPKGMRSFHDKMLETTHPNHFVSLKGKHKKTLEKLLDNKRFSSVTYKKFAALWRSINGPDSIKNASSGGSHKALLDQNRKVVTGIFAHGEAQTFGKNTIMYIRDAFNQIGYGLGR